VFSVKQINNNYEHDSRPLWRHWNGIKRNIDLWTSIQAF